MNRKLDVLQHSLGLDRFGLGPGLRNHYCAGPGHHSYAACVEMCNDGLMEAQPPDTFSAGDTTFVVTPMGREFVRNNSPRPDPIALSAKRPREYLSSDFGWLGI